MGTSTRWPGPKGGAWIGANRTLLALERAAISSTLNGGGAVTGDWRTGSTDREMPEAAIAQISHSRYAALSKTLLSDPNSYGLQTTLLTSGERLIDTLDQLTLDGPAALGPLSGDTPDARLASFVQQFVGRVVGAANSPANAAARRTATECAREILKDPYIRRSIEHDDHPSTARMSSELLCWIYQLFFANAISQFIQATISAKINLLLPWWHIVDPAGKVAAWLTSKIVALLPNPCSEAQDQKDTGDSVTDLARSLLKETVQRALGLPIDTSG